MAEEKLTRFHYKIQYLWTAGVMHRRHRLLFITFEMKIQPEYEDYSNSPFWQLEILDIKSIVIG